MEANLRNTPALLVRINHLSEQLVKKYMDITQLAKLPISYRSPSDEDEDEDDEPPETTGTGPVNRNQAAVNSVGMEVEVGTLIKTAEEVLSLTRQMKEAWLFGQLDTLGENSAVEGAERDAKAVEVLLDRLRGATGEENT